jgi:hypothetical protein
MMIMLDDCEILISSELITKMVSRKDTTALYGRNGERLGLVSAGIYFATSHEIDRRVKAAVDAVQKQRQ